MEGMLYTIFAYVLVGSVIFSLLGWLLVIPLLEGFVGCVEALTRVLMWLEKRKKS